MADPGITGKMTDAISCPHAVQSPTGYTAIQAPTRHAAVQSPTGHTAVQSSTRHTAVQSPTGHAACAGTATRSRPTTPA